MRLSHAPRVGSDTTLILSIRSLLLKTAQAEIWFRFPHSITPRSPDRFEQVYFPPDAPNQQYSVRLHVDKPGNYPLQASIYAMLADGETVIQHF